MVKQAKKTMKQYYKTSSDLKIDCALAQVFGKQVAQARLTTMRYKLIDEICRQEPWPVIVKMIVALRDTSISGLTAHHQQLLKDRAQTNPDSFSAQDRIEMRAYFEDPSAFPD